jgi:hypothetical protein
MGWQTRDGKKYLYRSVRTGNKVRSRYVGSGKIAELIYLDLLCRRAQAQARRQELRELISEVEATRRLLDCISRDTEALVHAHLLLAGFHQHHRSEWRKRREPINRPTSPGAVACRNNRPIKRVG